MPADSYPRPSHMTHPGGHPHAPGPSSHPGPHPGYNPYPSQPMYKQEAPIKPRPAVIDATGPSNDTARHAK